MQLVLEYFTVFEGVLLLQALCTADGELYIVINTPILLTILKPSPCGWVFTSRQSQALTVLKRKILVYLILFLQRYQLAIRHLHF